MQQQLAHASAKQSLSKSGAEAANAAPANWPLAFTRLSISQGSPVPLYQQIARALRTAIVAGELPAGTLFPTSRELARVLGVGRNTIVEAYTRLSAEGFIASNTRRGTRVADGAFSAAPDTQLAAPPTSEPDGGTVLRVDIGYRARRALNTPVSAFVSGRPFALHAPDPLLYPRKQLGRLLAEEFRRPPMDDQRTATPQGMSRFQAAVAAHVRQMRGVYCSPEQIVPVTGLEGALELTIRAMIDPGHTVFVENPALDTVPAAFEAAGAQVYRLSANEGAPPPRMIFVSPNVGFPFGHAMDNDEQAQLLENAYRYNAVIFESDAYGELSYSGQRLQALQGQDRHGSVIYFGSLAETLGPHLRVGYLVVPQPLAGAFTELAKRTAALPDMFVLAALGRFIEENRYAMHVRAVRALYAERLQMMAQAARAHLNGLTVAEPTGGLHLTLTFREPVNTEAICAEAARRGLSIAPLSRFWRGGEPPAGLVLGFGAVPDRMIDPAMMKLAAIIAEARPVLQRRSA